MGQDGVGRGDIQAMALSSLVSLWLQEEAAGGEQDALDLYQHSLGELLLLLAGEGPHFCPPEGPWLPCPHHTPSLYSGAPGPEAGAASH